MWTPRFQSPISVIEVTGEKTRKLIIISSLGAEQTPELESRNQTQIKVNPNLGPMMLQGENRYVGKISLLSAN